MSDFYGFPPLLNVVGANLDDDLLNPGLPSQIRSNFLEPAPQDPQGSRDLKVLQEAGIDPSFDLEEAKSRFLADQVSTPNFIRDYPTLAASLASKDFVQTARDDMGNIIETEGWWNEISNAYNVARDTVAIGNIGTRAMLEGRDLYPYERRKLEQSRQFMRVHRDSQPGWVASAAELVGTMQETLAASLGASYVAGAVSGPAAPVVAPIAGFTAAFATSFNLEAGNLYAELVAEQGYTPAQAADIASKFGAVIAGVESIGIRLGTAGARGLGRELLKGRQSDLLRRETFGKAFRDVVLVDYLGKGVLGEAGTEGVQEALAELAKRRASEVYRPDNLYEPEYSEAFSQAFFHTAKGMVVLGGVPAGARLAYRNVKAANAKYDYERAQAADDIRDRSRAPEAQRQIDSEAGETSTLNSDYYLRAQDFQAAMDEMSRTGAFTEQQVRDTVEANSPGLMAQIDEAAQRDGEVKLTKSEFDQAFKNTLFGKEALRHTAREEDGLTRRESELVLENRERLIQEQGEAAQQELQDLDQFERGLREVRQDVRNSIREQMKGMDAAQVLDAAAYSSIATGFIRRAALQMNISPREFYNKYFPQIVQQRLEGQQAQQAQQQAAPSPAPTQQAQQQAAPAPAPVADPVLAEAANYELFKVYLGDTVDPVSGARVGGFTVVARSQQEAEALAGPILDRYVRETNSRRSDPAKRISRSVGDAGKVSATSLGSSAITETLPAITLVRLAQKAAAQNVDLTQMSREQYVDFAIQNGEVLTGDMIRLSARLRVATDIGAADFALKLRSEAGLDASKQFDEYEALALKYKGLRNTKIDVGEQQGRVNTLDHASGWINFRVKGQESRVKAPSKTTSKVYVDFGEAFESALTEKNLKDLMRRLANAGFNGQVKIGESAAQMERLGDQLVVHGDSAADAALAETVVADFLSSNNLQAQTSVGQDAVGASGKKKSYSELLAEKTQQAKAQQQAAPAPAPAAAPAPRPETLEAGEQRRKLGEAEVEGGKAITKILLDPNAKPTTLMHELMHWNLELMADIGLDIEGKLAQEGYEATMLEAQMLGDIQRLLKWSGFEGTLTEWRAMSIDQRREFHEAIAVSFERYLYEGVAPSRELRGVFRRLVDYIRGAFEELVLGYQRDYERLFKRELPGLNDEVRAIFGRMMSAERDVQAFFDQSELDAMLMTREEWVKAGRDAQEYDEYEQEFKDSMYESKAELTQRRMDEVGTFTRAYELVARKQRAELNRIRAQIRREVEAEVRLQPVYQLRSWIKGGTFETEKGPVTRKFYKEDGKTELSRSLDREMVEAINPELAKKLSNRRMLKKGGMPLDAVRNMFGFESNEAMLQALADSRNLADEITHRTDQRLLNEHTDLMDPVVQQENIHAAVHNKIRQRVLARELKFLLNNGRSTKVEMKAMADAAEQIIENTPTGDIDIAAYSRAAARARKKGLKALKDGDMEAAKFAKRQELLNEALIREGLKVRAEVRRLVNTNKRVFKRRTDKAIAEAGYDVTVVKAARALLFRMGIGRADFDPADALARFRQEDPEFYEEVRPQLEYFLGMDIAQPRVGDRRKPMEHLTPGDVRSLRGLAERMMKRAKDKLTAKIGERKENIDKLRQEAQDTMESNVEVKRRPDDKSIFGKIRDYFSDIIRFEHLFRRIDGGKVGIWTQMFRQVKDAANMYRQELRQFLSKDPKTGKGFDFEGKLRNLDLKIPGGVRTLTMDLPSANRKVEIGADGRHAKTELIHLAMHYYGNSSNRKRLVEGYAGRNASEQTMQQVDAEIRRFLEQQVQQGILTRKDFEFMQSIFDHFSSKDPESGMLARAQKVMKNLRGYEMQEVKAEEFPIQFPGDAEATVFGGGYIPIRFKDQVQKEEEGQGVLEEDASLEQQASRMVNILPGFTKDRVKGEVGLELYLGLSHLANHAAEVYRFINMAEPIDSVSRVLNGRDLAAAFKARFGNKAYRNLEGWLKRSAFQRFERGDESQVGSMLLRLSRNANMSVMFLNIGNTLQNYAGLVIPMRRVGKRRIISALIHGAFNKRLAAEVAAKSPEMKARLERQIFDIYSSQNRILTSEDSAWVRLQGWSDKYAYVLQQVTQNHVDVAVWQAAYNQETEAALRENVSAEEAEARAIAHADSIVRQSQMAGEKEDISAFESGGPISRALFPFKSWFINWFNNAATQRRLDMKVEDRSRVAAIASTYLYMLMIPAILAEAATELARGEDWDDDDDGYGDDMTELFFRSQIFQVTGGLPVLSEASRVAYNNWFDDEYWNNRYPVVPWARALERLAKTTPKLGEDPLTTSLDMTAQMASLMGVPASGAFRRLSLIGDEIAGELESESTYDFLRGAVTGQRSDLQRLSQ